MSEPGSVHHDVKKVKGMLGLSMAGVYAVLSHMIPDDPTLQQLLLLLATLFFLYGMSSIMQTNRYMLPLMRAFGWEADNYYHRPPEERIDD